MVLHSRSLLPANAPDRALQVIPLWSVAGRFLWRRFERRNFQIPPRPGPATTMGKRTPNPFSPSSSISLAAENSPAAWRVMGDARKRTGWLSIANVAAHVGTALTANTSFRSSTRIQEDRLESRVEEGYASTRIVTALETGAP